MDKGEKKSRRGRPPLAFKPEEVRDLRSFQMTDEELASMLGVSVDTIARWKKNNPEFFEAYHQGKSEYSTG